MRYFLSQLLIRSLLLAFLLTDFAYADLLPSPEGETPASLACIYGLTPAVPGCTISGATAVPNTGSGAIAIIDGEDDPNAFYELTQFSNQFTPLTVLNQCNGTNSNPPCFQQYYVNSPFDASNPCVVANSPNPASFYGIDPSGDVEPELDIEWAHAMAPNANIYMIETQGWGDPVTPGGPPDMTSLLQGIQCATNLFQTYNGGRGIISYSHSFPEWAGETAFDTNFQTPGIIYIMSAGDYSAPANYPAASPYVIAAGGTSIVRDAAGKYVNQVAWNNGTGNDCDPICKTGGSGGPSQYESRPAYQNSVQKIVGTQRGTPDISFAAAGIDVFCCKYTTVGPPATNNKCCGVGNKPRCESFPSCGQSEGTWVLTGGTSFASPALAGIINSANSGATTTTQELTNIYNGAIKNYHTYWTDIISGNNGYSALKGYDFTTGLGVPRGYSGK